MLAPQLPYGRYQDPCYGRDKDLHEDDACTCALHAQTQEKEAGRSSRPSGPDDCFLPRIEKHGDADKAHHEYHGRGRKNMLRGIHNDLLPRGDVEGIDYAMEAYRAPPPRANGE